MPTEANLRGSDGDREGSENTQSEYGPCRAGPLRILLLLLALPSLPFLSIPSFLPSVLPS